MTQLTLATNQQIDDYRAKADAFMVSESSVMFSDSKLIATMAILEFLAHQDGRTLYTHLAPTPANEPDMIKVEAS